MKKSLLTLLFAFAFVAVQAQCVLSCSIYSVTQTTYSVFPSNGPDVTSSFLPNTDDGSTGAIPIGFTFTFHCTAYSDVYICSNGFIQFTAVSWAHGNVVHPTASIPSSGEPNNMIAFNATDLYPGLGGSVTYTTVGTAPNRMFIVTYSNVPNFTETNNMNTGQIVLHETTNEIEIHTTEAHGDSNQSGTGSQGIENANGTIGPPVPGRSYSSSWFPGTNTAYRFSLSTYVPAAPTAVSGTISTCKGISNMYTVTTMPGATSYSWTLPSFWTGTSTSTLINTTSGVSGVVSASAVYTCGTSSPATLMVNVIPSPVVGFSNVNPPIFCSGVTTTINTNGAANYTLQPGNFVGTPPFTDTPLVTTVYTVTGEDANGCRSENVSTYTVTVKLTPTVTVAGGSVCIGQNFTFTPTGADNYSYSTIFSQATPTLGVNNYSIWGFNNNGCKSQTVTVSVTAAPLPTISATAARPEICSKESTVLTPTGGVSYQWLQYPNTTTMSVKPIISTTYSLTGTDANGCTNSGTVQVIVKPCTAIDEQDKNAWSFKAYPNPAHDVLSVNISFDADLVVYDALGRSVYTAKITAGQHRIEVDNLPAGKYLLSARSPQVKKNLVFIKD